MLCCRVGGNSITNVTFKEIGNMEKMNGICVYVCLEQSIHLSIPGSHIQPVEEYKVPVQSRQTFGRTNKWTDSMLDMHVAFVIVVAILLGLPKKRKVRQKHVPLQGMFDFLHDFHKYPTRCLAFRKALEVYPWGRVKYVHMGYTLIAPYGIVNFD